MIPLLLIFWIAVSGAIAGFVIGFLCCDRYQNSMEKKIVDAILADMKTRSCVGLALEKIEKAGNWPKFYNSLLTNLREGTYR